MAWFDAGVNLLDKRFDVDSVIDNALNANVQKLCVIATHPNEWDGVQALHSRYPQNIVFTLGVHPHNAKDVSKDDLIYLESLVRTPGLVAIGECGLDFNRDFSPRSKQIEVFEAQADLAKRTGLPLYLHERDAFDQQILILSRVFGDATILGIAHCFTGTPSQLQTYLQKGLFIGITGWLCDEKRGGDLREAIQQLPLERLILETDAPYLFPKTIRPRKKHNEPAYLPAIANTVAELVKLPVTDVERQAFANTLSLFGLVD